MKFLKKRDKQLITRKNDSENRIRKLAFMREDELYKKLSSSQEGIDLKKLDEAQDKFGLNVITIGNKNTVLTRLREALINPFSVVLIVIAIITFFTDVVSAVNKGGRADYLTVSIILLLIIVSGTIAFIQGERSNTAAEKLSKMISNKVDTIRGGSDVEVLIEEIVPGDIIRLSAGDMIPADIRFIFAKDAFIAQAALTGESNPVEKYAEIRNNMDDALTDLANIGFMGSNMVSGSALGIALATGNETYIGAMAKSLTGDRAKNSFERGVQSVSGMLIKLMLIMVPIVFLINGILKKDWAAALLFSVSIAVGLTPEMLPVIMTSTLAKGAMTMSRHKVIVKVLGSIQAFGEMDILCTDKTGTLTDDKIVLEKYMNVLGEDDGRILRHAYLNSHFQTGLKNLIDLAIINRAEEKKLHEVIEKYICMDEIPFDFARRRMSVVLEDKTGKRQLITKGAVEEVVSICSFVEWQGEVISLNDEMVRRVMLTYERYNEDGLRMIAVAQKNEVPGIDAFSVEDESDMVLIGFVGFLDPPKESARDAISALHHHGVRTVVITGDSEGVAVKVCSKVGVDTHNKLQGIDVEKMSDDELCEAVKQCNLFSKMSPNQKARAVRAFQHAGHTVGYLGDGINDAPPLRAADVGISVDSAVDIAKETADIILLEKDLMVLEEGVIEGRKTFGNIIKYIKMAASGNFGNMVSVIVASIFLPFLPMIPVQLLAQNLLCDFSQMGMAFDNVDKEYLEKPRKWDTKSIKRFMWVMGPLSSIFDVLCFVVMWWAVKANTPELAPLFQCGWFVFGTVSQVLVIHMIRTSKIPFIQSRAATPLMISTLLVTGVTLVTAFTGLAVALDMMTLPPIAFPLLLLVLVGYCLSTQLLKVVYIKKFGEWL